LDDFFNGLMFALLYPHKTGTVKRMFTNYHSAISCLV